MNTDTASSRGAARAASLALVDRGTIWRDRDGTWQCRSVYGHGDSPVPAEHLDELLSAGLIAEGHTDDYGRTWMVTVHPTDDPPAHGPDPIDPADIASVEHNDRRGYDVLLWTPDGESVSVASFRDQRAAQALAHNLARTVVAWCDHANATT